MRAASSKHMDRFHCSSSQVGTILATIMCLALALGFVVLGGWLIVCGFGAALGALFTGHGLAIVILLTLGFTSLAIAMGLCAVPIVLINRSRTRKMICQWEMRQKQWKGN